MAMDSNYSSPMGEPLMEALEEEEEDSGPPTPFFDLLPPEPKGECSEQAQETVSIHTWKYDLRPHGRPDVGGEGPESTMTGPLIRMRPTNPHKNMCPQASVA